MKRQELIEYILRECAYEITLQDIAVIHAAEFGARYPYGIQVRFRDTVAASLNYHPADLNAKDQILQFAADAVTVINLHIGMMEQDAAALPTGALPPRKAARHEEPTPPPQSAGESSSSPAPPSPGFICYPASYHHKHPISDANQTDAG
jgi:hypothetical protein